MPPIETTRLLTATGILAAMLLIRLLFEKVILRWLIRLTALTSMRHDDLVLKSIQPPATAFLVSLGFYLALLELNLPARPLDFPRAIDLAWGAARAVLAVWLLYRLVTPLTAFLEDRLFSRDETARRQFTPIITGVLRFVLVGLAALFIAHNMGYQVTSLLAGLGIGGLAVALAAQDTLANILGTVVVLSDQPFRVGDLVTVDGQEGTVESVGFRSTRIRTLSRSLIVVPNKLLTERQIENRSAMNLRWVKMTVGLVYSTPPAVVEAFVAGVRDLLDKDPGVEPGQTTVAFTELGSSSLEVLIVYYTSTTAYDEHLAVRQRVNLEIMRLAAALGTSFAFPTRTIFLTSGADRAAT